MPSDSTNRPPHWVERLLRILLKPRDRDTVAGDLLEQYRESVLPTRGRLRADLWYLKQAVSLIDGAFLGAVLGLTFGLWDLFYTWMDPLADDTPVALLAFYGPMFAAWGFAGFMARRRSGRILDAVKAGTTVAFVTFIVFYLANLARVNVFLETIRFRADWQNMVARFETSGWGNLRAFINYDYLRGAPLKIGVASVIGATFGLVGGLMAHITRRRGAARNG